MKTAPIHAPLLIGRRPWGVGLLAALATPACAHKGTYTRVEEIWRADTKVTLKRVLVIAAWADMERRSLIEGRIAEQFVVRGVPAKSAEAVVDEGYPYPKAALHAAATKNQLDGAVVVRLIAYDNAATLEVTGPPVGDDPRARWSDALQHVYKEEGLTGAKTARCETLVYEVATEKLLWSGLSETFAPADALDGAASYGKAITGVMLDRELIAPS